MRLKVSGDRQEIRQSYVPSLYSHVVQPLMDQGAVSCFVCSGAPYLIGVFLLPQSAVDEVIDRMDDYFLNREDWDTLVELGVGDHRDEVVLKKISPTTKTTLTKRRVCWTSLLPPPLTAPSRYNAKDHPVAFHKAEDLGKAVKKLALAGPAPDLEEAIDVSAPNVSAP